MAETPLAGGEETFTFNVRDPCLGSAPGQLWVQSSFRNSGFWGFLTLYLFDVHVMLFFFLIYFNGESMSSF